MDKPFSVICEEFKQELADLINNSGLPPFVIESVLQNYLSEISGIAKKQYQFDKTQYEKSLYELNKDKEENKEVKDFG